MEHRPGTRYSYLRPQQQLALVGWFFPLRNLEAQGFL